MKLIIKTLDGKQIPIVLPKESTISELKTEIEKKNPNLVAATFKLKRYGKFLSDDKNLTDYNLKDGDFILA